MNKRVPVKHLVRKPIANPCVFAWSRNAERISRAPGKCGTHFPGVPKTRSAFLDHAETYRKTIIFFKRCGNALRCQKMKGNEKTGARETPCAETYSKPLCFHMVQERGTHCAGTQKMRAAFPGYPGNPFRTFWVPGNAFRIFGNPGKCVPHYFGPEITFLHSREL